MGLKRLAALAIPRTQLPVAVQPAIKLQFLPLEL
jgi:hypothetical protein